MRDLKSLIRDVPDFPKPGILFRDITTLLREPQALKQVIDRLHERFREDRIEEIIGVESRGFILASALAYRLGTGMIPVRKPGRLPSRTIRETYSLEYGEDSLEMHADALSAGQRVLVVDDLLATGGTAAAAVALARRAGGDVVGCAFMIELLALKGRSKLDGVPTFSLISY